jgi:hypothetical protein
LFARADSQLFSPAISVKFQTASMAQPPLAVAKLTIPRTPVHTPAPSSSWNATSVHASHSAPSHTSGSSFKPEDFGDGFDMKSWINSQLASRAQQPAESNGTPAAPAHSDLAATTAAHLSSLLMKLQLMASDLNTSMEQQSQELVQAMPKSVQEIEAAMHRDFGRLNRCALLLFLRAMREISFIHRESQSLRGNLADILKDMSNMEGAKATAPAATASPATSTAAGAALSAPAAQSSPPAASATDTIEFLQSIDVVQGRILRCAHTLEEIDQWRQRENAIEKLFDGMQRSAGESDSSNPSAALVSASSYSDLARLHHELRTMQSVVERFRSMGLGQEHQERLATLQSYQSRMAHLTEVCLDQTLEQVLAEGGAASSASDSGPAEGAAAPSFVTALQVLNQLYIAMGKASVFESKYQNQKLKPALALHVLNKYTRSGPTPKSTSFDVARLDSWLSDFYSEVLLFTRSELDFAQQVFGSTPPPLPTTSVLPDRSRFPSVAERDGAATTEEKSQSATGASASTVATSTPNFTFVYSALLESLHDELVPLLSVWFSGFLTAQKDSPNAIQLVLQLWEMTLSKLGWPLAQLIFPQVATPSSGTVQHGSSPAHHLSPLVLPRSIASEPVVSAFGLRLPQWTSEAQLHSQQNVLVELLYEPFLRYIDEYASLEQRRLLSLLDALPLQDATSFEQAVDRLTAGHKLLLAARTEAQERCMALSGGVLLEALLKAMQDLYGEFVTRALSLVKKLRKIAGLETAVTLTSPKKGLPGGVGSASIDGLSDMLQDSSSSNSSAAAAAAAAAELSNADAAWSHFASLFQALKTLRQMQTDLFSAAVDDSFLELLCGQGQVLQVMRGVEEERERLRNGGALPSSTTASKQPPLSVRRNSFGSATPNLSSVNASNAAPPAISSSLHSAGDLSRALYVSFLLHHPDRLRSLDALIHRFYLPSHPSALSQLLTSSQLHEHSSGTQGLITPLLQASSTSPGGLHSASGSARYGFPAPSSMPSATAATSGSSGVHSHLFTASAASFESLVQAVQQLLYDTMFHSIAVRLASFADWHHIWAAKAGGVTSGGQILSAIPLPSFSMQPSDYIIAIGEHLLTLVQQLEPYVKGSEEEEEVSHAAATPSAAARKFSTPTSPFTQVTPASSSAPSTYVENDALYWLNLLSRGTFAALLSSFPAIPQLSERGARQLSTDLEYLINVLSALGLTIPPIIHKLTAWLTWSESTLAARISGADSSAEEHLKLSELHAEEKQILRQLIRCRHFKTIDAPTMAQLNQ